MSKTFKLVALVVAAVLVAGLVGGIALYTANNDPYQPKVGLFIDGKKVKDADPILTIGEYEISMEEYRLLYLNIKAEMEQNNPSIWEDDFDGVRAAELKEEVERRLTEQYAMMAYGAENGVTLSDEEKQEIVDQLEEIKKELGDDFTARLQAANFSSEEFFIQYSENGMLVQKSYELLQEELTEQYKGEVEKGAVSVKHILIPFASQDEEITEPEAPREDFSDETEQDAAASEDASGETAALEKANEIYAMLLAAEDLEAEFNLLRLEYSQDPGQPEEGYTFAEDGSTPSGAMTPAFTEASVALKVGEVSQPVRTEYGYHIILRVPLDEEYVKEYPWVFTDNTKMSELFLEQLDALVEKMTITPGKYYDKISIENVK